MGRNAQTQRSSPALTMTYIDRTICTYHLALGTLNLAFSFGLPPIGKTYMQTLAILHLHPALSPFLLFWLAPTFLHQLQLSQTSDNRRTAL